MLCAEKYPSLSLVQPVISILLKHYLLVSEGDVMDIVHFKNTIAHEIRRRFSNPSLTIIMNMATALDPRFKHLKHLPSSERPKVFEDILDAMQDTTKHIHEMSNDSPELPSVKRLKSGDFFDVSDSSSTGESDAGVQSTLECKLAQYQAEKEVPRTDNPLDFWKVNEHRFKTMAKLARKYHCITATSAL